MRLAGIQLGAAGLVHYTTLLLGKPWSSHSGFISWLLRNTRITYCDEDNDTLMTGKTCLCRDAFHKV
jgi:hypothetical protein